MRPARPAWSRRAAGYDRGDVQSKRACRRGWPVDAVPSADHRKQEVRPPCVVESSLVVTLVLVASTLVIAGPGRRGRTGQSAASAAPSPASRWRGSGTRRCSMPSAVTSRGPPSTPATSTTCRPACGTPGPPTTRSPTASSSTRSSTSTTRPRPATRPSATPPTASSAHRYGQAVGAEESLAEFDALMASLCYPTTARAPRGDSPAALGNRIAAAHHPPGPARRLQRERQLRARRLRAGQRAAHRRAAGHDDDRPQSLAAAGARALGRPERHPAAGRGAAVRGPALGPRAARSRCPRDEAGLPIDPGAPPRLARPVTDADVQGGGRRGHPQEQRARPDRPRAHRHLARRAWATTRWAPTTATGYERQPRDGRALRAEHRAAAATSRACSTEFWADGPRSETPPGHWNTIANDGRRTRPASSGASAARARSSTRSSGT